MLYFNRKKQVKLIINVGSPVNDFKYGGGAKWKPNKLKPELNWNSYLFLKTLSI